MRMAASTSFAFRSFIFAVGDLAHLVAADLAGLDLARLLRARLQVGGLLQEIAHRRRLHREGERLVLVIGDDHRNGRTLFHFLRLGVERLAEFHDVDATLTERRADRGRRSRRSCRNLELELARYFLSHSLCLCFEPDVIVRRLQSGGPVPAAGYKAALASHPFRPRDVLTAARRAGRPAAET